MLSAVLVASLCVVLPLGRGPDKLARRLKRRRPLRSSGVHGAHGGRGRKRRAGRGEADESEGNGEEKERGKGGGPWEDCVA